LSTSHHGAFADGHCDEAPGDLRADGCTEPGLCGTDGVERLIHVAHADWLDHDR